MKIPWWTKLLSYIKDIHVETTSSFYNDALEVLLSKGEYQLVTPDAIYSYGMRYDNFLDAFKKIKIKEKKITNALILGLGLGSIPYMLEKRFDKKYQFTAIEIDPEIIHLASKYVLDDLQSSVTTICADAMVYMALNDKKYDLICMDIFVSDYIPEEFESHQFLAMLKDALSPSGILMYNRLYLYDKDQKKTDIFFERVFKKIFPDGKFTTVPGNKILINK